MYIKYDYIQYTCNVLYIIIYRHVFFCADIIFHLEGNNLFEKMRIINFFLSVKAL